MKIRIRVVSKEDCENGFSRNYFVKDDYKYVARLKTCKFPWEEPWKDKKHKRFDGWWNLDPEEKIERWIKHRISVGNSWQKCVKMIGFDYDDIEPWKTYQIEADKVEAKWKLIQGKTITKRTCCKMQSVHNYLTFFTEEWSQYFNAAKIIFCSLAGAGTTDSFQQTIDLMPTRQLACPTCGEECVWDMHRPHVLKRCLEFHVNDALKSDLAMTPENCRWILYSELESFIPDYSKNNNGFSRRALPACVVAGIRGFCPDPNDNYTGFNQRKRKRINLSKRFEEAKEYGSDNDKPVPETPKSGVSTLESELKLPSLDTQELKKPLVTE